MLRLREARWEIEILPERGGRVRSLRLDGVELLDQGIGVDNPQAEDFVEGGAFGWDEMVPTVDRTDTLPDHGEAWRLPWTTVVQSRSSCSMECEGRVLPWRLRRQIVIAPDGVQVNYDLTNIGSKPIPGFWCAHPLFKYEAGMEVDIGSTLMAFAEGKSAKFFLPRGAIDHARLKWEAGPAIEISWDAQAAPYCGVWICNGDIGGYRQVAIEPSTGGGDRPDSDEPPPTLQPGESLAWWLKIRPL